MENIGIGAGLGALGLWLFIAAVVVAGIWDGIRKREANHETLRRMIESGKPMDQELLDKLFGADKEVHKDLKIGALITLSAAPGLALMGWFLGRLDSEVFTALLGVSALVACVGIGLWIAGRFAERRYAEEERSS